MIIVTGATGFLGSHIVCSLLQAGHSVCGLKRNKSSLQEFNYIFSYRFQNLNEQEKTKLLQQLSWTEGDLNDVLSLEEAFRTAEEVYHCAAMVSFHAKDQEKMNHINVDGTTNVVNAALLCGVKKLCYISSIAALGRTKSGLMIDEKTHWDESPNNSNYAISKHKAEMEVWRGIEEGLDAVIVNPGVIMGVGDWNKGSVNMLKIVSKGLPFYSTGVNGYVGVEDVAKAAMLLMEKNLFGQRYILVSENVSVKDFFETAAKELGKKAPYIKVNKLLAEIAWRVMALKKILTGKKANITKETARASLNQYFYNNQKVKDAIQIDFKPVKQTIAEACKQLINKEKQSI